MVRDEGTGPCTACLRTKEPHKGTESNSNTDRFSSEFNSGVGSGWVLLQVGKPRPLHNGAATAVARSAVCTCVHDLTAVSLRYCSSDRSGRDRHLELRIQQGLQPRP